ncbi:uncharacterized protein A4U43_C03F17180 [Asparagus officinalis]|uniref:Uncharacterized protein n=1 Tax=Asparagus officinalis TaxID=4686 RepID=A0A5P1FFR4_ASPOF|nr:uncharacterized protein A4U43_C03F17180 [Asparagus officinalis]
MRRPRNARASSSNNEANGIETPTRSSRVRRRRARPAPVEPEYFAEKRNLEDLWQAAFPVGTEWDNMDKLREINWNFSNLEKAFEEGGEPYGKTLYVSGSTEPEMLVVNGEEKRVVSPIPPSDKIGVKSVQQETEDITPMKAMEMAWIPYIPLENRNALILLLSWISWFRAEIVDLQPLKADEDEENTVVDIIYPSEPPEYVREQIRKRKREQRQAREARIKAIEDVDPETKAAFENMRIYKFYPVQTPGTPDISNKKVSYINRY